MDDAIAFCVIVLFIVYLREHAQREFIARGKFITRDKKNGRMSPCVSPWCVAFVMSLK